VGPARTGLGASLPQLHCDSRDSLDFDSGDEHRPPVEPRCLRWTFPVWNPDDSLDPEALRVEGRKRRKDETPKEEPWTVDRFARAFVGERSTSRADILVRATQAGLSERKALTLLKGAESTGAAFRLPRGPREPAIYSRSPQGDIQ
jgi:hypothetical protein